MKNINYNEPIQFIKYANNHNIIYEAKVALLWKDIKQIEEFIPNSTDYFKEVEDEAFWIMTKNDAIVVKGNYEEFLKLWQVFLNKTKEVI